MVPGGIRFVGVSTIWGGGMAVYDARAAAQVAVRAYLITAEQFVDVLAQEMRLTPPVKLDLGPVRESGWHSLGPGRYQTLAQLGTYDDLPMLTFTSAAVADHPVNAPTDDYLRTMALGLREAHDWSAGQIGLFGPVPGGDRCLTPSAIDGSPLEGKAWRGYERRASQTSKTRGLGLDSANPGRNSTSRRQSSLRSSPVTSVATTGRSSFRPRP
jgi:hypothetical protein